MAIHALGNPAGPFHVVFSLRFLGQKRGLMEVRYTRTPPGALETATRKLHGQALGNHARQKALFCLNLGYRV
jgi:hypothetical protein